MVPEKVMVELGAPLQPAEAPARTALLLMADESRNGQLLHSAAGRFKEIEESVLVPAAQEIIGEDKPPDDDTLMRIIEYLGGEYKDDV